MILSKLDSLHKVYILYISYIYIHEFASIYAKILISTILLGSMNEMWTAEIMTYLRAFSFVHNRQVSEMLYNAFLEGYC